MRKWEPETSSAIGYCAVKKETDKLLEAAINKLGLSARAYSRVHKVSRTIADLAGSEEIEAAHIVEAIHTAPWIGEYNLPTLLPERFCFCTPIADAARQVGFRRFGQKFVQLGTESLGRLRTNTP